jgi:hypothetical protein
MVHKPLGDINMSVQMIELEEVQMLEVSDAALEEARKLVVGGAFSSWGHSVQSC